MTPASDIVARAEEIAADRDAGASELLARLLPVLADATAAGADATRAAILAVVGRQPGMASLWNACAAAAAELRAPGTFARTRAAMERAPTALGRAAAAALADLTLDTPQPRLLTLSYSGAVRQALADFAGRTPLEVVCAESRPRFEGRRLAADLAAAGARVTLVTDAALASFLPGATGVVVGADAVERQAWINKVGTRALASSAATLGVPVLVLAAQDKFVPPALVPRLDLRPGPAGEVWAEPPIGLQVANPVFEATPLELAFQIVTDRGPVGPDAVASAAQRWEGPARLLLELIG